MARRRKQSPAEDLVDLVAMLPWWAGVALAMVSYLVLHAYAARPVLPLPGATPGAHVAGIVTTIWHGLAGIGQYVIPLLCVAGAVISAVGRKRRRGLLLQAVKPGGAAAIADMSWQEFELLVGEAFRRRGCSVLEKGGGGADGGVDLVLDKAGERYLVQCKHWRAFKVGVSVVREFYGLMAAEGAVGGYIVTSGVFSDEAREFASGRNVELISGTELPGLLGISKKAVSVAPQAAAPLCPRCRRPMTHRVARRGTSAGKPFWGCSTYPACRGVLPMAGG